MKRFRNILFVVDEENPSETAFRRAFERAAINDARLTNQLLRSRPESQRMPE